MTHTLDARPGFALKQSRQGCLTMPWFLLNVDSSCLQMDGLIDLCAVVSQARKLTAMQAPIARRPRHFSDLMAANHQGRS